MHNIFMYVQMRIINATFGEGVGILEGLLWSEGANPPLQLQ